MAPTDDDAPRTPADHQPVVPVQAAECRGHGRNDAAVGIADIGQPIEQRLGQIRLAVEVAIGLDQGLGAVERQHTAQQPLVGSDPKRRARALLQPVGQPQVVGVEMRRQDPADGPFAQRSVQQGLPQIARRPIRQAGVDKAPARIVFQQPHIDVIELEGQR